ncbi:unnamed protein product [Rotaria magnacalcarata]|uniref:TBC1 domain family member 7 n=2 Tax=Rotaria magnacalcarata TaxID=392030 RepID=A0A816Z673_9BILA|nr:unnamed protein product [Rotaria magnacalcarata]CAF1666422.1 unnamed protein product [Rotaria magnacalcarata]CAF1982893.1 unnamed protein product [Rotaria magnacalcarata]CAF2187531.1 unnamed protein product [Rotaria magnacalcarata]CAF3821026.1 unnamed protein product [Rotaria magnacalcarata]
MTSKERTVPTTFKELLISEAINVDKLKQDILKNSIVAELKPFYWKILLGIKSPFSATRDYVDQANCDMYKYLHSTLITCKLIQTDTPISQQFLSMYLLDLHPNRLPVLSIKEYESFLLIANFVCAFLDNDNKQRIEATAECWLMTCRIYDKFVQLSRRITLLRYHVGRIAQEEFIHEPKLLVHLNTQNIFICIPEKWLKDGFQLLTDDISLLDIWEKFLAGSEYIFVFLTIHILHHCRLKLLSLYTTKEIMQYLLDLKINGQIDCEHIVMASIVSWKKQGGSLLTFPPIRN